MSVASSRFKSRKTEICCMKFLDLICCARNLLNGLINIEEIRYKTHLLIYFKRILSRKVNMLIAPFWPYDVPFSGLISIKYG